MGIYKKFVVVSLIAILTSFMFLSMIQLKNDNDLNEESIPWGHNFEMKAKHYERTVDQEKPTYNAYINNKQPINIQQTKSKSNVDIKAPPPPSSNTSAVNIWPSPNKIETNDRIVEQLYKYKAPVKKMKTVVLISGPGDGNKRLHSENCAVTNCVFTSNVRNMSQADGVVFFNGMSSGLFGKLVRPPNQIWVLYLLESPHHSSVPAAKTDLLNWTATYRRDSVLVTPYEKFVHFSNYSGLPDKAGKNYAQGKTKKVAWFVSNCNAPNGRTHYVNQLQKYIDVDIYGGCGTLNCPKGKKCDEYLRKNYKFYLAFENSHCKDYITEKLYWNALMVNVLPVVMGAHPDDYRAVAPPGSFIHVDEFESPKMLAEYLHKLDQNDDLYNSYFRWIGTGEFINTKFWCRLCNMIHAADSSDYHMQYTNMPNWWNGPGICVRPTGNELWATWRGKPYFNKSMITNTFQVFSHTKNNL